MTTTLSSTSSGPLRGPVPRSHWRNEGHALLGSLFDVLQRAELQQWVSELASWPEVPGKWMTWYERSHAGRQLCRIENFVPYHAGLASMIEYGVLCDALTELVGEPMLLFKDKINFKLPGGAGFAPHQDAGAFSESGQSYHVTAMVAIDPATRENGCLEVVSGYHGAGTLPVNPDGTLDAEWVAAQRWEAIEMHPGDVLFFDAHVPHRSRENRSGHPRRALYVTYNLKREGDFRAEYFARKRAAFPPECERLPGVDYQRSAAIYNLGNPIL